MICFPNCKINLGLYITRRREDGYHDLETVFYPLSAVTSAKTGGQLNDVLEVVPAAETKLHTYGYAIAGNDGDNLVLKAYQLLKKECAGKLPALDIFLRKAIPMGAGLGGGSADGAFTLRLLNDACKLGFSNEQLAAYALQLGSDCPFFIYNTPKFATGRGEQMSDITLDLSGYSIQVICPEVHVSTGAAFQMISPKPAPYDLRQLAGLPPDQWKDKVDNDFEEAVFKQHSVLAEIKKQLYDQGAIYASMSGSGSAIYGIFPKGKRAQLGVDVSYKDFYIA